MRQPFLLGTLLAINLCGSIYLSAQERGVSPVATPSGATARVAPTTYAVVVGISNYQSPDIPDLQFAHHDARAFADWLQSPAGGQVPEANIQLLTEKGATFAAFAGALDWLVENTLEDAHAII